MDYTLLILMQRIQNSDFSKLRNLYLNVNTCIGVSRAAKSPRVYEYNNSLLLQLSLCWWKQQTEIRAVITKQLTLHFELTS